MKKFTIFILFNIIFLSNIQSQEIRYYKIDAFKPSKHLLFNEYKYNGYWGLKNILNDSVVIEAKYDTLIYQSQGMAIVKENKKWGLIDIHNNTILRNIYDTIEELGLFQNIKFKLNNKYGLVDNRGKILFDTTYSNVYSIWNTSYYFLATNNLKKYTIIDTNGKMLSDFLFDCIYAITEYDFLFFFVLQIGDNYGIYNKDFKEIVPIRHNNIDILNYISYFIGFINKKGFLDTNKRDYLPIKYNWMSNKNFYLNYEPYYAKKDTLIEIEKNGKWGMANLKGDIIIPIIWDEIDKKEKFIKTTKIINGKKKVGIINFKNEIIIPHEYEHFGDFNDKYIIASKNNKVGVIDFNNKKTIDFNYTIIFFTNNTFQTRDSLKEITFLDSNNSNFLNKKFSKIYYIPQYEILKVCENGKYGLYNNLWKLIAPIKYEDIGESIKNGLYIAKINDKYDLYDTLGNNVTKVGYDLIIDNHAERMFYKDDNTLPYLVVKNKKFGFINHKGEKITEIEYDYFKRKDGLGIYNDWTLNITFVCKNNLYGMIDKTGKIIIPLKYTDNEIIELWDDLSNKNIIP